MDAVNLDEVVQRVFHVPFRRQHRVRVARIRDEVPMAVWNRYLENQRRLPTLSPASQLVWMVQQIALVWQRSEPQMTPYRLAEGLSYDQVVALHAALFARPSPPAGEQSIERRNFATRKATTTIPPEAMRDVPLVTNDWDEEARQNLLSEAARIESRDPETAAFLRAQAAASLAQVQAATPDLPEARTLSPSGQAYNATQLYSRMGEVYPWMSKDVIDAMHYVTFFAYVREATLRHQPTPQPYRALNQQSSEEDLRRYFGNPARTFN